MDNTDVFIQDKFIRTRLANIRKSKGLSQAQLSEISGLSTSTISNIESGDNSYTLRSLIKYSEALGYEINIDKKIEKGNDDSDTKTANKTIHTSDT